MSTLAAAAALVIFPGGIALMAAGLGYEWLDRKVLARLQNRAGPRWFQPVADTLKLLANEEIVPRGVSPALFRWLPILALAGPLAAAVYLPVFGLRPCCAFAGDLIVVIYLLSLPTLCRVVAGAATGGRFALVGVLRTLTQGFAFEAPFLAALLAPAAWAGSWQIAHLADPVGVWAAVIAPVAFVVAVVGLMAKLELAPFDAPEAETEIVAGALTEYSGRGLALFRLAHAVELVLGLTLIATVFLGGVTTPIGFLVKTGLLLVALAAAQALVTRLRIDQTVGLWWRYGALLVLGQWLLLTLMQPR